MERLLAVYAAFEDGADATGDAGPAGTGYDRRR